MGDVFDFEALMPGAAGAEGEGDAEEGDAEEVPNLHSAASEGDAAKLKELLEAGDVDVDEQDDEGRTALHFAAGYGELECATLLIGRGAKVDLLDNNKNTALHYAAGYGQADSVKLLLDRCGAARLVWGWVGGGGVVGERAGSAQLCMHGPRFMLIDHRSHH